MLIEFRIKNFRSFDHEQTLSLMASNDPNLQKSHTINNELLRTSAIYGINASGKSNLIHALSTLQDIVLGKPSHVSPFKYNEKKERTTFDITFSQKENRYRYTLSLFENQIALETLFENDELLYSKENLNSLFLSEETYPDVYAWFLEKLIIFKENESLDATRTISLLQNADKKKQITHILSAMDQSIQEIIVQDKKLSFIHQTKNGKQSFSFEEEAAGIRTIFAFLGSFIDALDQGATIFYDEIDTSLHSFFVQKLIQLFYQPETNIANAQLIFTTHDTGLFYADYLLRKDQVWWVHKTDQEASELLRVDRLEEHLLKRLPFLNDTVNLIDKV